MATLVARPDADPETSTFDGYVTYTDAGDATWATVRGAAAANGNGDADIFLSVELLTGTAAGTWQMLTRSILGFATAGIPDDATITAADLKLTVTADAPLPDNLSQGLNLSTITAPASATAIANGDYNVTKYGSTKLCDTDRALTGMAADTQYTFTLNASGLAAISKTGVTWLALRLADDITNTEPDSPGGGEFSAAYLHSADAATEANRPVLTVTYTVAGGGVRTMAFSALPLLMDGNL